MGSKNPWVDWEQIFLVIDVPDIIAPFKCGDDRFRGFGLTEGHILPFPILQKSSLQHSHYRVRCGAPYHNCTICDRPIDDDAVIIISSLCGNRYKFNICRIVQRTLCPEKSNPHIHRTMKMSNLNESDYNFVHLISNILLKCPPNFIKKHYFLAEVLIVKYW